MVKSFKGTITHTEMYAECSRVSFRLEEDGKDEVIIRDGILYLYKDSSIVKIASTFDINLFN